MLLVWTQSQQYKKLWCFGNQLFYHAK